MKTKNRTASAVILSGLRWQASHASLKRRPTISSESLQLVSRRSGKALDAVQYGLKVSLHRLEMELLNPTRKQADNVKLFESCTLFGSGKFGSLRPNRSMQIYNDSSDSTSSGHQFIISYGSLVAARLLSQTLAFSGHVLKNK